MSSAKEDVKSADAMTVTPGDDSAAIDETTKSGGDEVGAAASVSSDLPSPDIASTEAVVAKLDLLVREVMREADGMAYPDTTVAGALDYLVRRKVSPEVTYVYVIDRERKLLGVVALRDLLLAKPGQTLGEIMTPEPLAFPRIRKFPMRYSKH